MIAAWYAASRSGDGDGGGETAAAAAITAEAVGLRCAPSCMPVRFSGRLSVCVGMYSGLCCSLSMLGVCVLRFHSILCAARLYPLHSASRRPTGADWEDRGFPPSVEDGRRQESLAGGALECHRQGGFFPDYDDEASLDGYGWLNLLSLSHPTE